MSEAKPEEAGSLKTRRLFIAIDFAAEVKKKLGSLRVDIPGARWVPVEQIHLTLAFLGEVEEPVAARLTKKLGTIQTPEFELSFNGSGCFPNLHRPRVLWLGLKPQPRLHELVRKVYADVLACGIPLEERPFSPHITLARLKLSPPREMYAFLDQNKMPKLRSLVVSEFTLFESRLTQQGAIHIPLRSFRLAIAAAFGKC